MYGLSDAPLDRSRLIPESWYIWWARHPVLILLLLWGLDHDFHTSRFCNGGVSLLNHHFLNCFQGTLPGSMGSSEKHIWEICRKHSWAGFPLGELPSILKKQMHIVNLQEKTAPVAFPKLLYWWNLFILRTSLCDGSHGPKFCPWGTQTVFYSYL